MNVGKSIKILLAQQEIRQCDLATKVGMTRAQMSYICSKESCAGSTLKTISDAFDMKVSEFIAIGE